MPKKLSEYPDMLSKIPFFSRNVLSNSDLLRKNDYANIKKRNKLKTNSNNFDEFISNLEIKLNVCSVDIDYDRISQLFSRTNRSHCQGKNIKFRIWKKKLKMVINYYPIDYVDKFGPSGVIGAILLKLNQIVYTLIVFL